MPIKRKPIERLRKALEAKVKPSPENLDPDDLGSRYFGARDKIDRANMEINQVKELVQSMIEKKFKDSELESGYVKGRKYRVGFFTRGGKKKDFSEELFKTLFPDLYEKCLETQTLKVFSPEKFKRLHERGKITKDQILKATVTLGRASRVVDIKPL